MNLLFSCIGKRGYIADFFRPHLEPTDRIVGTGNTRWTPGFQSCDTAVLLPDIEDEGYVPAVLDLCEKEDIDAVLSFNDRDVYKLSHSRDALRQREILPLFPTREVAELAFDKYRLFDFLADKGIATPRTALALEEATDFTYPLYVKPRHGSGSHDTFVVRNEDELAFFFNYRPDMIIQESVEGKEFDVELCGDLAGRPIGLSTWKKYASRLGETEQAETFHDPVVTEFALRLGEILRITGPADLDVFRNGDAFTVLEVNTRFGGGYPVSHLAGANFPRLLVELVKHGTAKPDYSFDPDVIMMKRLEPIGGKSERFFRNELNIAQS